MTNKTWIRRVLNHDGSVPAPYNFMLSPPARSKLEKHYGTDDVEGCLDLPIRMTGLKSVKPLYASPREFGPRATDEFGVEWTTNEIDRGCPVGRPITVPELDGYTFPDPAAECRYELLAEWCERNAEHYTFVWVGDLWERATFLCGMENLLLWSALEPDFVDTLLGRLAEGILRTMDVLELKETFGEKLTFCGGLGTQDLLARATPEEVREEVHRLKRELGRGGGYILEPGITIQADVPAANTLAMIEAAGGGE